MLRPTRVIQASSFHDQSLSLEQLLQVLAIELWSKTMSVQRAAFSSAADYFSERDFSIASCMQDDLSEWSKELV